MKYEYRIVAWDDGFIIARYLVGTRLSEVYGGNGTWVGNYGAAWKYLTLDTAELALSQLEGTK